MAEALLKEAPSKKERVTVQTKEDIALSQGFDIHKKYMFELVSKNPERELPVIDMVNKRPIRHIEYKPVQNIVLTSQVVWNGQRRMVRYYDGCSSIFVDEQPKDKDQIEQLIKQTNKQKYRFLMGKFGCYGDERMLLLYLFICSWNGESEFRTRTADSIFISSNKEKQATIESNKLDQQEKALRLAKDASDAKMMIHANFLGIMVTDIDSGNDLSPKEIRTEYRKKALSDSDNFINSYSDKAIEMKYHIDKALIQGLIKANGNKAIWSKSGLEICDISGLRSNEAISEKLVEVSQLETGEEFAIQIMAIYN